MKNLRWSLFLFGLLSLTVGKAQIYDPVLTDYQREWDPADRIFYLSSPDLLTPEQAFARIKSTQAQPIKHSQFKKGFHPDYFWFYLKLKNPDKPKTVVLSFDRADFHHVQCFRKVGGRVDTLVITGDALPFTSRPVLVNGYAIPIALDTDQEMEIVLFADKRNEFIESKFGLYELNRFYEMKRYEFGQFAVYLGMVIFLVLFNLFLWWSLKDTIHLFFIAQLISSSLFLAANSGFINEWSLLDIPYKTSTLSTMLAFFWISFNFFFINGLLKLSRKNSRFYRLNRWCAQINLAMALVCFIGLAFVEYPLSSDFMSGLLVFMEVLYSINILIFTSTLIEQNIKRNPMARLYGWAILFIVIGFTLSTLDRNSSLNLYQYLGEFSKNFGWGIFGVFFEQLTLAFGLTLRYNLLNRKNSALELSLSRVKSEVAEKVIQTQETERQRLAKDLHDGLGGTLSTIKGQAANENVSGQTLRLIEKAIEDLRSVSRNLMPPELEKAGLTGSVYQAVERLRNVSKTEFIFITFGREVCLQADAELNIYRIIGELLNNILKHARASKAVIQLLYYDDYLLVSVEDNGVGIKTEEPVQGIGLKNIRSRVEYLKATLSVDTGAGGTTVMVRVPFVSEQ